MRWRHSILALFITLLPVEAGAAKELGLCIHQSATLGPDAAADAGLKWVRVDFDWITTQPLDAAPDFTQLDAVVNAAQAKGLSVLAVLGYTPAWASAGDLKGLGSKNDVPIAGKYEAFVTATVNHFKDRVTHYELWNEPNLEEFFGGSVQQFVDVILKPGADAVKAACPTCTVVAPGLATLSAGQVDVWLEAILTQALAKIDVVNGHIYHAFPDGGGAGTTSNSFFNDLDSHRVVKVGGLTIYEGPLSFKELMDKHGVTKPLWITETGAMAAPGDTTALAVQETFYRHVLEAMLTRPWWTHTFFYEAEDNSGLTWGVVTPDGMSVKGYQDKPVMALLRQVTSTQPAFGGNGSDCADGLDNDGDQLVDSMDPECLLGASESVGGAGSDGGVSDGGAAMDDGGAPGTDGSAGVDPSGSDPVDGAGAGSCAVGGSAGSTAGLLWLAGAAAWLMRRRRRLGGWLAMAVALSLSSGLAGCGGDPGLVGDAGAWGDAGDLDAAMSADGGAGGEDLGDGEDAACTKGTLAASLRISDVDLAGATASGTRVILSLAPSGAAAAWAASGGKIHVTALSMSDTRVGTDVIVDGTLPYGLAASATDYAILVSRAPDYLSFVQVPLGGGAATVRDLLGGGDHAVIGTEWFGEFANTGRLVATPTGFAAYFGLHRRWPDNIGHQGDTLRLLGADGSPKAGGWDWGCSHSLDQRLVVSGSTVGPVCVSDCYPEKAILFDHDTQVSSEPSGDCKGGSTAQLGGLVPDGMGGFWLSYASKEGRASRDLALAHLSSKGAVLGTTWLTDAAGDESNAHLAGFDGGLVAAWRSGTKTYALRLDAGGQPMGPAEVLPAPLNSASDFISHPNGDVGWAWIATGQLHLARLHACL